LSWDSDKPNGSLTVNNDSYDLASPTQLLSDAREDLCSKAAFSTQNVAALTTWVAGISKSFDSECASLTQKDDEFECRLTGLSSRQAIDQLLNMQQVMIRKWSRQPYIVARKAGITLGLARAFDERSGQKSLEKFCRVLRFSLPEELPIVTASSIWQNAVCREGATSQELSVLVSYALERSLAELDVLRQLYEKTSRVGLLLVKVPPSEELLGTGSMRVTITPEADVAEKLAQEAQQLLRSRRTSDTVAFSCWHPFFAVSDYRLMMAEHLGLVNPTPGFICKQRTTVEAVNAMSKYLTQSLSSETEFMIDNGQTKLLRLPEGRYSYSIDAVPANPLDFEEGDQPPVTVTKGVIAWGRGRSVTIEN
jgi:hypothetical protein